VPGFDGLGIAHYTTLQLLFPAAGGNREPSGGDTADGTIVRPMPRSASQTAYALLRFIMGVDMLLHGLTRIGAGVGQFAATMVRDFQATMLPPALVHGFGLVLPFVEALIGLGLLFGCFTRAVLIASSLLMAALVFGTALRSEWNTVGLQLVYAVIYYFLLTRIGDNCWSIDALRGQSD
jgi:thiosulfate dehydrogenase (quinone) large subunit